MYIFTSIDATDVIYSTSEHKNYSHYLLLSTILYNNKKAQLSLTNPRDACEKFARFT